MALFEIHFSAMGCQMMAALDAAMPWESDTLAQVPQWFETWEQHLSRFRADSELSELNRSSGQPFSASPVLWAVFQAAVQAERRSRGRVTPTVYDALIESGYAHSFSGGIAPVEAPVLYSPRPAPPLREIEVDMKRQALTLPPGVHLDFGGVAKGWSADQALSRLQSTGAAIVDAGGDIAVGDPHSDGQLWPVGIGGSFDDADEPELLMVANCGVATSGRDYRRWLQNGVWQHHLIDPSTGRPAETDVMTATVIAHSCVEAEMAAKVVLLAGHREGMGWLEAQKGCEGMVVLENGRRITSRHFSDYLWRDE